MRESASITLPDGEIWISTLDPQPEYMLTTIEDLIQKAEREGRDRWFLMLQNILEFDQRFNPAENRDNVDYQYVVTETKDIYYRQSGDKWVHINDFGDTLITTK